MAEVLVLNGSYQPVRAISWQRAVRLWYRGKAEIIENYEDSFLRSQKITIQMPAVIRLLAFFKGVDHLLRATPPFSRKSIFERDKGFCQYCGRKVKIETMTLDHVIPRSLGGKREWNNVVTCCNQCNTAKANRTPKQAGMSLKSKPVRPSAHFLFFQTGLRSVPHPSWRTYLYPIG